MLSVYTFQKSNIFDMNNNKLKKDNKLIPYLAVKLFFPTAEHTFQSPTNRIEEN